jgi:hypothetical protein
MNRRLFIYGCGCLIVVGFLLAGGWAYWDAQPPADAWVLLDPSETILSGVPPGEEVKTVFRLRNTSRRAFHVLGGSVC